VLPLYFQFCKVEDIKKKPAGREIQELKHNPSNEYRWMQAAFGVSVQKFMPETCARC